MKLLEKGSFNRSAIRPNEQHLLDEYGNGIFTISDVVNIPILDEPHYRMTVDSTGEIALLPERLIEKWPEAKVVNLILRGYPQVGL
jgi:hypothetical protein